MDKLLATFKQFEMSNLEKSRIYGGVVPQPPPRTTVNGCSQGGGNSYIDYISYDGQQVCDLLIDSADASDWIDTICPEMLNYQY